MGEKDESAFSDGMSGEQQRMFSKDFYLTKSQVMRRFRGNKLRGDCDENLLGGLLHEMNETQQLLNCMRLPWMKLADAFFQGYVDVPSYSKDKRLLASRLIALMVKLSRETSFVEKWFVYNSFQAKEIKELEVACKMRRLYSISIGDELLYDLSLKQLVEIHDTIETFLEQGDTSFQEFEDDDLCGIDVDMSVCRFADKDTYGVSYYIDTYEGEMHFTSSEQISCIIEQMQQFLDRMEKREFMNIEEATEKEEAFITIREDYTSRKKVLNEIPLVSKSIRQCDGEALTGSYTISANGLYLNDLSSPKLKEISVKLEEFLESVDKQWKILRTPVECGFES
ncbi:hypothetical protein DWW18_00025 [Butyricimonas virosa]|uniref:Uncharacterized protein n=1 Tax=Butyricimonas virosa TaxID=544645 RepID=A0A412X6M5_9BACT|nr:hypothetical protein [Butyricimonas virosa]RGV36626.1 hypothetical protein DWW18_00025 [Butyricimonas virosa]